MCAYTFTFVLTEYLSKKMCRYMIRFLILPISHRNQSYLTNFFLLKNIIKFKKKGKWGKEFYWNSHSTELYQLWNKVLNLYGLVNLTLLNSLSKSILKLYIKKPNKAQIILSDDNFVKISCGFIQVTESKLHTVKTFY